MDVIHMVVDKFLVELQAQLDDKQVSLHVSDSARKWLAEKGYDKTMGARPMARVIQNEIKRQLANEILFGKLANGGNVNIQLANDELTFEYTKEKVTATET